MRKERNKIKLGDLDKIRARFVMKYEEFDKLPLHDEIGEDNTTIKVRGLRTIFREDKMSATDKRALIRVVDNRLNEQMAQARKQNLEREQEKAKAETEVDNEPKQTGAE